MSRESVDWVGLAVNFATIYDSESVSASRSGMMGYASTSLSSGLVGCLGFFHASSSAGLGTFPLIFSFVSGPVYASSGFAMSNPFTAARRTLTGSSLAVSVGLRNLRGFLEETLEGPGSSRGRDCSDDMYSVRRKKL